MGFVLPIDILCDVSFVLVEPYVDTILGPIVVQLPAQIVTATPPSMVGIYVGALLVINRGALNQEIVTVSAVTATTFTFTEVNIHLGTDTVTGATFPSGLFTQSEMLGYLLSTENDFLLDTRCVYAQATQDLASGAAGRYYPQPADAIRIERISSSGKALMDTSTIALDQSDPNWQTDSQSDDPKAWFQDDIGLEQFGIWPLTEIDGLVAEIWYSQKDINSAMSFLSPFVLPDIFTMYLKYGVLARVFSKDGEQRDSMRSKYCAKRYEFGVFLARTFLLATETLTTEMQADQAQMQKFAPLSMGSK